MKEPVAAPPHRPASAVSQFPALIGTAAIIAVMVVVKWRGIAMPVTDLVMLLLAVYALPNLVAEFIRLPDVPEKRDVRPGESTLVRLGIKAAGLAAMIGAIALGYAMFPVYGGDTLAALKAVLDKTAVPLLIATPAYLWMTDARMKDPYDGCYMAGLCVLGRWRDADTDMAWQFVLGWLVKAFFLPMMLSIAVGNTRWLMELDTSTALGPDFAWYETLYTFLFLIDVLVGSAGYLLTLKLFDTHIRSAEPTVAGWVVALARYAPFSGVVEGSYLHYENGFYWGQWLADYPLVKTVWAVTILVLVGIYVWATISFGVRFSNLTHRGILTNGPYRWVKHPAYVAKNITYWMIAVPFVVRESAWDSFSRCLMLVGVNLIFYARAKTEERHLMRDPVYEAYSAWIAEHGLWAKMKRLARPPRPSLN
jgi:protein-S-isoprenylcysteine O-methyltransferase Ste14